MGNGFARRKLVVRGDSAKRRVVVGRARLDLVHAELGVQDRVVALAGETHTPLGCYGMIFRVSRAAPAKGLDVISWDEADRLVVNLHTSKCR